MDWLTDLSAAVEEVVDVEPEGAVPPIVHDAAQRAFSRPCEVSLQRARARIERPLYYK